MKEINLEIECKSCNGTGVYVGKAEREGAGILCISCDGTGKAMYHFSYNKFTGRKTRSDVTRVYKNNYGYIIAPKQIDFENIGTVDLSIEGISYKDFIKGRVPDHIKVLACPLSAEQETCHKLEGFIDECNKLNGGWINYISSCKYIKHKDTCWKRFDEGKNED